MALHNEAEALERHLPWNVELVDATAAGAMVWTAADVGKSVFLSDNGLGPSLYVVREVSPGVYAAVPLIGVAAAYEFSWTDPAGVGVSIAPAGEVLLTSALLPGLVEQVRHPKGVAVWDVDLATGILTTKRSGRFRLAITVKHKVSANAEYYVSVQRYNTGTLAWDDVDELLAEDYRLTAGSLTRTDFVSIATVVDAQYRFAFRHLDGVSRTWTFYRLVAAANYLSLS